MHLLLCHRAAAVFPHLLSSYIPLPPILPRVFHTPLHSRLSQPHSLSSLRRNLHLSSLPLIHLLFEASYLSPYFCLYLYLPLLHSLFPRCLICIQQLYQLPSPHTHAVPAPLLSYSNLSLYPSNLTILVVTPGWHILYLRYLNSSRLTPDSQPLNNVLLYFNDLYEKPIPLTLQNSLVKET